MDYSEYSKWMGVAAIFGLLAILALTRIVGRTVITKPKLQKGALIIAVSVSVILLVWGILYEVFR